MGGRGGRDREGGLSRLVPLQAERVTFQDSDSCKRAQGSMLRSQQEPCEDALVLLPSHRGETEAQRLSD